MGPLDVLNNSLQILSVSSTVCPWSLGKRESMCDVRMMLGLWDDANSP